MKKILLITLSLLMVYSCFAKSSYHKIFSNLPNYHRNGKNIVILKLYRGSIQDNGATPWYAVLGFGTPPQKVKFMLDTGEDRSWISSIYCSSNACKKHFRFNPSFSSTYQLLGNKAHPNVLSFGPWGNMLTVLSEDILTIDKIAPLQISNMLSKKVSAIKLPFKAYLSLQYSGKKFKNLLVDGGISFPCYSRSDAASSDLMTALLKTKAISSATLSTWFNKKDKVGQYILGGIDRSRFDPKTLNIVKAVKFKLFPSLWSIPVKEITANNKFVIGKFLLGLDSGSSKLKGDPRIINKIKMAITKNRKLPTVLHCRHPKFSQYPTIIFHINQHEYFLKPQDYFLKTGKFTWKLGLISYPQWKNYLWVGSIFLDTVYTIFYRDPHDPSLKLVGLAMPK